MSLPSPNLDDRDFEQLVEQALRVVQRSCREWTDLSPGDPGRALIEVFAHLTETMIYRLNRLPEKAYVEFLRLIGVRIRPPAAASVMLRFRRSRATDQPIEIPRGTRVTVSRTGGEGEPPLFVTTRRVTIPAGETETEVLAYHSQVVEGELVGIGTGLPGLSVQARQPPMVEPTGDVFDLVVGVEADADELDEQAPVIQHSGQVYRLWREVDSFTNLGTDRYVYVADRMAGAVTFAPAARMRNEEGRLEDMPRALAAVPSPGREIRLWYRHGGGAEGNVAAGTLTVLKDPIPGVEVTNPAPAGGGKDAETVENALLRGPQELHSLHRAVTARDFELLALYSSRAVARARAMTRAALWSYATPGTVEVLLVPDLPAQDRVGEQVTVATLRERQTETVRNQIQHALDERRPLGTTCIVNWARYKIVHVSARIVVRRQEDQAAVRQRVIARLHQVINPLPAQPNAAGWPFGQALRASHIYDIALAEPGVLWVDRVRLLVEEVPDVSVTSIAADAFQSQTWYAGSGSTLYRSLDAAEGWEPAGRFSGEQIQVVRTHPERAGMIAVATQLPDGGSRIHLSSDCGESWASTPYTTVFEVEDLAWTQRGDAAVLWLATDAGLYELTPSEGGGPVQVLVDPEDPDMGFYAIATSRDVRGQVSVAVAAQSTRGVYLSAEGGRPNTFWHIGLRGQDIRVLEVQYDGPRSFLWAGASAAGGEPGQGCFRWELVGAEEAPEEWQAFQWQTFGRGWLGGSCHAIAFLGTQVVAATHRAGVLRLPSGRTEAEWEALDVNCGLPLRDPGRFYPVDAVATDPDARLVMAGGQEGVHRSRDGGVHYEPASAQEFLEKVTLPPTWLFCSGDHDVVVESEDEADRD